MSQNDFSLANQGFPAFRSDMNSAFQALASNSSGATAPSTTYAYQWWYDTSTDILKMRNGANDGWINIATFDQTNDEWLIVGKTSTTGSVILTTGTTAQRDGSPAAGYVRYNTTTGNFEGYGSAWNDFLTKAGGTLTGAVQGSTQTASITGSTTLDFATYQNFVLTLTGNVTLANPTTEVVGQSGFIVFVQDGTGGRTCSLGTDYETAGGAGLTLSAAASATDIVPYIVAASGRILLGTPTLAMS